MSLLKRLQQGEGNEPTPLPAEGADNGGRMPSLQARRVAPPATAPQQDTYQDLKTRVQNKLLAGMEPSMDVTKTSDVRRTIQELLSKS